MKFIKPILITLGVLLLLVLVANFALTRYITKKLPTIISEQKDFPYNLSYKDLDVNLLTGSLSVDQAFLAPKDSLENAVKNGVFAKIESIDVSGVKIWQLIKHDKIIVKKVTLNKPEVILYNREKKYSVENDIQKPFEQTIQTGSLYIKNGSFKMMDSVQNPKLRGTNISFELHNIKVDSATVEKNIPIRYRDYKLSCDSLFFNAGQYYNITLNNITTTDSTLSIDRFRMLPKQNRKQFSNMLPKELDQFNIEAGKINIPKADWGFANDTLYVHAPEVALEKVFANIYRSKEPKDDPTRKKLYSELLRSLKFDLKVDKLLIKNSTIEYEEQLNFGKPAAKVSFSKFYATISNVYSPIAKAKLPNTTIDVQCLFMKSAPLKVNWSFNSLDESDSFTIVGRLQNIRSEEVNPITKPLMNAETSGTINEVRFTFNGNRIRSNGSFAINYEDLKVDIYKKDGKKKNKVTSALGNLLVKNDSKGKLKEVQIAVDRKQDKSVFNFLWRFVQEGLKETVLPKIVT
ncbi:hypothetical protein AM493_16435 [Flavobacterium akiainvivens]|uniref:DUF748 domain-containing protein n=1 Tax=Flavobacterium akiainvivens TaxID=1202724 RepID=A0A0N0RQZ1_9FLAO|nr:hypothetical protein [Flavobacterium akiainvivens]KOS07456.1 hypothetical protein AM493_16435 [Flavobacterium akiainvivens]SFQ63110.1 hypothetical protein SAMN05444144_11114 [Flavobacterium akiainvivens]